MNVGPPPRVSVVMPVRDGSPHLDRSLPPLVAAVEAGRALELLVVDDGSTDGSAERARELGARVLTSGGAGLGPGRGRNVGVEAASGDVVLFVDADVVVHDDALDRIAQAFADPGVTAMYGTYDDAPDDPGFASQYMNLRHHHGHARPSDDAMTFWAGLGAVRRGAFREVGGFDAERFPMPSVEDIDLGRRLRAAGGRIRRDPTLQGRHLKRWTLGSVVRTDLVHRALPWSQLIQEHPDAFGDLNVSTGERGRVLLALALATSLVVSAAKALPWWTPALLFALAVLANLPLALLFLRRRGPLFVLGAMAFHQLHHLVSAAAFGGAWLKTRLSGRATGS